MYIVRSRKAARRRKLRAQALVGVLVAALAVGAAAWWRQEWLKEETYALLNVTALKPAQERALKAGDSFKECGDCPEMVVVPAGRFMMGSPEGQGYDYERPRHEVTIARPFAVAKFTVTFDDWDACTAHGACAPHESDSGWGRGRRPVIYVSWDDAQNYVKWLSGITGKPYRLLSEAEYEYSARAGGEHVFPWGDDTLRDGEVMANYFGGGHVLQTVPVDSFDANSFGLYQMVGNVFEWTEDCWNESYEGAPLDGSSWTTIGDCGRRVYRGGAYNTEPDLLRSAYRFATSSHDRFDYLGFRVARTLTDGAGAAAPTSGR
jgi:formylglycine-generating enzyme required for sulfatase activity